MGVLQSEAPAPPAGRKAAITVQTGKNAPGGLSLFIDGSVFGTGHDIWTNAQANGGDLRMYSDVNLTNQLPLHVRDFNQGAETCRLWTRVPSAVAAGGSIYIGYGPNTGSLVQPGAGTAFGSQNVYQDEEFAGDTLLTNLVNSAATTVSGATAGIAGPTGETSRDFTVDVDDYVDIGISTLAKPFSFRCLAYWRSSTNHRTIFCKSDTGMNLRRFSNTTMDFTKNFIGSGPGNWRPNGGFSNNTWYGVGITYDGTLGANDPRMFRDGVLLTGGVNVNPTTDNMQDGGSLRLGGGFNFAVESHDGYMCEARHRAATISDADFLSEIDNWTSPGTFWVAGAGGPA